MKLKILLIFIPFAFSLSVSAGHLSKDFSLIVKSPKLSFEMNRKGNYIRFTYLGERTGFYVKSCYKDTLKSLNSKLKNTLDPLLFKKAPESSQADGVLVINGKERNFSYDPLVSPGLRELPESLSFTMRKGRKRCEK